MSQKTHILPAWVFIVVVILSAGWTVFPKDLPDKKVIQFTNIDGLQMGSSILFLGVKVGYVSNLSLRDNGQVDVEATFTKKFPQNIPVSYKIKDTSFIGGKHLAIEPVTRAKAQKDPRPKGELEPSIVKGDDLPELIKTVRRVARNAEEKKGSLQLLLEEDSELRKNLRQTQDNIELIWEKWQSKQGNLSLLVESREMDELASQIQQDIETLESNLSQSKGTLGKLINDDKLSKEFRKIEKYADRVKLDLEEIAQNFERGSIGRLYRGDMDNEMDEVRRDVQIMMDNLRRLTNTVATNKGILPQLMSNSEIKRDLNETMASINVVRTRLENGEGTLGKLMQDEVLIKEIQRVGQAFFDSVYEIPDEVPIGSGVNAIIQITNPIPPANPPLSSQ